MLLRSALLACGLLCAQISGAMASVVYTFTQTAPMKPSAGGTADIVATAVLVVSDAAHAQGFSVSYNNNFALPGSVPQPTTLPGVEALFIGVFNIYNPVNIGLDRFLALSPPGSGKYSTLNLSAVPGGLLNGSLYFNTSEHDVRFTFDGTAKAAGYFNSDSGTPCFFNGCTFHGVQTVTVPEPASLALFGVGLAGLGLLRRRC